MAKKLENTRAGNPRKGQKYVVSTRADGRKVHTYAGGKRVVLPAAKKPAKKPAAKKPVAQPEAVAGPWYGGQLKDQQKSIVDALKKPSASVTGDQALSFAKALQATQIAPVLQQFDRAQQQVGARDAEQTARLDHVGQQQQQLLGQQIQGFQQSQDQARAALQTQGQSAQERLAQHWAQADHAAATDAGVRGAGLDAGAAAQRAQELANARARGERDTQIAVNQQLGGQQAGDALLRQIQAASVQQQGERGDQQRASTSAALRDLNEQRAGALTQAQGGVVETLMSLMSRNQENELGQMAIRGDAYEAEMKARTDAAKLKNDNQQRQADRAQERLLARWAQNATSAESSKKRQADRELESIRQQGTTQRAIDKALRDAKTKRSAERRKQQTKRRSYISEVNSIVASPKIRAEVLTPGNKDPKRIEQQLVNRGLNKKSDLLTRRLLIDRHVHGGPTPDTVRMYRQEYGANPPARWTTKKR